MYNDPTKKLSVTAVKYTDNLNMIWLQKLLTTISLCHYFTVVLYSATDFCLPVPAYVE